MNPKIAREIQLEQWHGREKYGNGRDDLAHDDQHDPGDWHDFIANLNEVAKDSTPMERRQYLLKVAGLAVSAIEAYDRKTLKK
jgi:hypothetical protein